MKTTMAMTTSMIHSVLLLFVTVATRSTVGFPLATTTTTTRIFSSTIPSQSTLKSTSSNCKSNSQSRTTTTSRLPQEPNPRTSFPPLFHMGHSHSHHHHDHPTPSTTTSSTTSSASTTTTPHKNRMRHRIAMALFCVLATLGPKVLRRKIPTQNDAICLGLSLIVMSSVQRIRRAIVHRIAGLKVVGDTIAKHSGGGRGTTSRVAQSKRATTAAIRDTSEADRVTWIGVVVNLVLSIGKLGVGIMAHSSALVADAGHSLSDLVSDFITLWSVQIARLPPDDDHPYGHYKFEAIGSLFLSLTLLATGFSVGGMAYKQLLQVLSTSAAAATTATSAQVPLPGPMALVMAAISIASKEWLYRITKQVGDKLQSPVVIANAWHHRSDAYSSVLALLSIAWAMAGFRAADAAAGLLVAGMICITGGDILVESVQQLSDSADEGLSEALQHIVADLQQADDDILDVTLQRARQVGSSALVDVTVETSPDLTTTATRAVEARLTTNLVQAFQESGRSVTATVHAKPNLILCPLLEAEEAAADDTLAEEEEEGFELESSSTASKDSSSTTATTTSSSSNGESTTTSKMTNEEGESDNATTSATTTTKKTEALVSASQIEFLVRQRALLLHPQQTHYNVQSVFVHYPSTRSVMVDITLESIMDISSTTDTTTSTGSTASTHEGSVNLAYLREQAKDLQDDLEGIPEIQQAKISLDLLADPSTSSMVSNATTTLKGNGVASPLIPPASSTDAISTLWSSPSKSASTTTSLSTDASSSNSVAP